MFASPYRLVLSCYWGLLRKQEGRGYRPPNIQVFLPSHLPHQQVSFFESIGFSNVGAVPVLIDKGVDVLARNEMALQITQRRKYSEITQILGESASLFRSMNEDNGVKRKNDTEVNYTASPRQKPKLKH